MWHDTRSGHLIRNDRGGGLHVLARPDWFDQEGKFADIIAVSGDPFRDTSDLERVIFVMVERQVVRNDLK